MLRGAGIRVRGGAAVDDSREPKAKIASQSHREIFDLADVTAFRRAVEALQPGATGSQIAALLDHKAKRTTVLQWYAGRRHAEPWALQLLARKIREQTAPQIALANYLEQIKDRPGKKAGAVNLARWLANRQ